MMLPIILSLLAGYLLGSVSFAVCVARARGVDIFAQGSGNPGATNVKRVLGRKAGNFVFVLDFLKGTVAAVIGLWLAADPGGIAGAAGAVAGHSCSVFLGFRGGKGVAVTMGALLALLPLVLLAGLLVWLAVFFTTRIVSLASVLFAVALPLAACLLRYGFADGEKGGGPGGWTNAGPSLELVVFSAVIGVLIVVRHRSNLVRLMKGQETSFRKDSGGG